MGVAAEIAEVYRRAGAFVLAMPLVAALPFAVELARQAVAASHPMTHAVQLGFSILSTLALVCVLVPALRWWRFERERQRVWRLGWRVLWGVVAMLTIQLTDEFLFTTAGHMAAHLTGGQRSIYVPASQLLWLFVSILLYGWYVAMLTDDPLTLRQAAGAMRARWFYGFAVVLGSLVPVLAIAMAFRMARGLGVIDAVPMAIASGILNAAIIVVTASAYFAIFRLARGDR